MGGRTGSCDWVRRGEGGLPELPNKASLKLKSKFKSALWTSGYGPLQGLTPIADQIPRGDKSIPRKPKHTDPANAPNRFASFIISCQNPMPLNSDNHNIN